MYCFDEITEFIEAYCGDRLTRSRQVPKGDEKNFYVYVAQIPCICGQCVDCGINDYFGNGVFFSSLHEVKQAFARADLDVSGDTLQELQEELEDVYGEYLQIVDLREPSSAIAMEQEESSHPETISRYNSRVIEI